MEPKIMSVTQLKPKLLNVISRAQKLGQEFILTKNGRPAAVIMSFEEWESWRETLEILSDKKLMRRVRAGLMYFNRGGKGRRLEDVFGSAA